MIAANGVTRRFLRERGFPSIRRVVRAPERWDRIQKLAADAGETLPETPGLRGPGRVHGAPAGGRSAPLPGSLAGDRQADGLRRLRRGAAGRSAAGHFGLAVRDYGHATAPNRRYPGPADPAAAEGGDRRRSRCRTTSPELERLAEHCTQQEDQARKVERQARKAASAAYLGTRIGETFDALVTGATEQRHLGPDADAAGRGEAGGRRRGAGGRRPRPRPSPVDRPGARVRGLRRGAVRGLTFAAGLAREREEANRTKADRRSATGACPTSICRASDAGELLEAVDEAGLGRVERALDRRSSRRGPVATNWPRSVALLAPAPDERAVRLAGSRRRPRRPGGRCRRRRAHLVRVVQRRRRCSRARRPA